MEQTNQPKLYTAHLFLDRTLRIYPPIKIEQLTEYLRLKAKHPLEDERVAMSTPTTSTNNSIYSSSSTTYYYNANLLIRRREPHLIFKLWKYFDDDSLSAAYLLDGLSDFHITKLKANIPEITDIGFEPSREINLNKLKRKLRSKKKMKNLLLRYYKID